MARARRSTFLGLPGSWTFPGWGAIGRNVWNTSPAARLFPPKVWGFGWSFNFAYPRIATKPFWARVGAFLLGLVLVLVLVWALVSVAMVVYFLLTQPPLPVLELG